LSLSSWLMTGMLPGVARQPLISDFDTCFQNLFSFQLLMSRQKVLGTTGARFG
jgi:hypothetical protein